LKSKAFGVSNLRIILGSSLEVFYLMSGHQTQQGAWRKRRENVQKMHFKP
jgi:hypothetical protein